MPGPYIPVKRKRFADLYVNGPEGVRGNGAEAYRQAGYIAKNSSTASTCATRLLKDAQVRAYIDLLLAQATSKTISQLQDWKELAPDAQRRIRSVSMGFLPDATAPQHQPRLIPIATRDQVAAANVILKAAQYIIDRAYPSRFYMAHEVHDPRGVLARLLGVRIEDLNDGASLPG